jgi:hypothetical protein
MVRWVRSFLDGRTASLYFDGKSTQPHSVTAEFTTLPYTLPPLYR